MISNHHRQHLSHDASSDLKAEVVFAQGAAAGLTQIEMFTGWLTAVTFQLKRLT